MTAVKGYFFGIGNDPRMNMPEVSFPFSFHGNHCAELGRYDT